jgi:hypothetical protein
MVSVEIVGSDLKVNISGWDVLWALKRRLIVPLANVVEARAVPEAGKPGWKLIGTGIPRGLSAGRFSKDGRVSFWVARQRAPAVVIELRNDKYASYVLQVEEPEAVAARINAAIGATAAA